jgi:ribonuclease J
MTKDNDLVFIPLGGVGEIGMNLALYGYGTAERPRLDHG